jgi:hypothetical protein
MPVCQEESTCSNKEAVSDVRQWVVEERLQFRGTRRGGDLENQGPDGREGDQLWHSSGEEGWSQHLVLGVGLIQQHHLEGIAGGNNQQGVRWRAR